MKFSPIDVFLIAGLGIGGFLGYRGGLVKKLFNVLMLLAAVVVASKMMGPIGDFLADAGAIDETAAYVAAFALVMIAVMVPALLFYRRFGRATVGKSSTTVFGVLLGIMEGAMLISIVLVGLKIFDIPDQSTRGDSLLYRPLVNFVPKTFDFLKSYFPGASDLREEFTKHFKNFEPSDSTARRGTRP